METKKKRREWVKTAAIILLAVLLVLTFFSQTIMNASLPEVSVQAVASGTINARIRVNGSVAANETYNVTIQQTRKIKSVKVSVGTVVAEGDVLFSLEPMESEELKSAKAQLETMELNYQRRITELANNTAREDRQTQKLQKAYDDAMAKYLLYSSTDPRKIEADLIAAQDQLDNLQEALQRTQSEFNKLQSNEEFIAAKADYDVALSNIELMFVDPIVLEYGQIYGNAKELKSSDLKIEISALDKLIIQEKDTLEKYRQEYLNAQQTEIFVEDQGKTYLQQDLYELFLKHTDIPGYDIDALRQLYKKDKNKEQFLAFLRNQMDDPTAATMNYAEKLIEAYNNLEEYVQKIGDCEHRINRRDVLDRLCNAVIEREIAESQMAIYSAQ